MVFNSGGVISVIFGIWLCILTIAWIRVWMGMKGFFSGGNKNITHFIQNLVTVQDGHKREIKHLEEKIDLLTINTRFHFQRLGIVRFNPFGDTGGSQSFTLALLDGNDSGFIITSLYARSGNRWYLKEVAKGKGINVELMKEEQQAIQQTKHVDRKGISS